MNWVVFLIGGWIMLGLELGLKSALELGDTSIAPSFLAIYAVFLACSAPARTAQWACLVIGLFVDLSSPIARSDTGLYTVIGPHALGALLMCQLVLALRGLMFRRNPLTLAFLSFVGYLTWQVLVTAIFTVRHLTGDPTLWSASGELLGRAGASLYTGIWALPVSLVLILLMPLFGFQHLPHRFHQRRG